MLGLAAARNDGGGGGDSWKDVQSCDQITIINIPADSIVLQVLCPSCPVRAPAL